MGQDKLRYKIMVVSLFAAAMAYIEAAVVVYLRELYYPGGFSFPLKMLPAKMVIIEVLREAATVVMLAAAAFLSDRKLGGRCGYLLYLFGLWDIFYYIWLKITLGWPSTLLEWDVLFLIPVPWIAPVLAPVLIAAVMVSFGFLIVKRYDRGGTFRPDPLSWSGFAVAVISIWVSFVYDTGATLNHKPPLNYPYFLLAAGLLFSVGAFWRIWRRGDSLK